MKRLTNRNIEIPSPRPENADYWRRVHLKLATYEDAEEQGLLVRLPCKVGDTVYRIWKVDGRESVVSTHCFDTVAHIVEWLDKFGKTVFATREEAEAALAKGINVSSKGENNEN